MDGDPVAVAGLDVAVDAVVGDVELAADEPLGERRLRPVQHLGERCRPRQPVGLLRPERQPVLLGLVGTARRRRWPARRTLSDGGYDAVLGLRLGHPPEPSRVTIRPLGRCGTRRMEGLCVSGRKGNLLGNTHPEEGRLKKLWREFRRVLGVDTGASVRSIPRCAMSEVVKRILSSAVIRSGAASRRPSSRSR